MNYSLSLPVSPVSSLPPLSPPLSPSTTITMDHRAVFVPPLKSTAYTSLYPPTEDTLNPPAGHEEPSSILELVAATVTPTSSVSVGPNPNSKDTNPVLHMLRNISSIHNLQDDNPYESFDNDDHNDPFLTVTNVNDEEEIVHQQGIKLAEKLLYQFQKTKQYRQVLTALYKFADSQVRNIFNSGRYSTVYTDKHIPFYLRCVNVPESFNYHKDLAKELHIWLDNAVNVCIQQFWPYRENRHVSHTLHAHNSFLLKKSSSYFHLSMDPNYSSSSSTAIPPSVTEFHPTFIGFPQHLLYQRLNDLYKVSLLFTADTKKISIKSPMRTNTAPIDETTVTTTSDGLLLDVTTTTNEDQLTDSFSTNIVSPSMDTVATLDPSSYSSHSPSMVSDPSLPIEVVDNVRNHFENILLDELYDITFHVCDEDVQEETKTASLIYQRARYYFSRPDELDIPLAVRDERVLQLAAAELRKINHYSSPELKMLCIANASDILVRALKLGPRPFDSVPVFTTYDKPLYKTQATGADDLLPGILWLILYCFQQEYTVYDTKGIDYESVPTMTATTLHRSLSSPWSKYRWSTITGSPFPSLGHALLLTSNSLYIQRFRDHAQMVGKTGYCYVHLQSCLHYILSLNLPSSDPNETNTDHPTTEEEDKSLLSSKVQHRTEEEKLPVASSA